MRRVLLRCGVLALLLAATTARAQQVEYFFPVQPAKVNVTGGAKGWEGYRIQPGAEFTLRAKGPGILRLFYFQEYKPGRPFPTDVRLLVAIDGAGKMFPVTPRPLPGLKFDPPSRTGGTPAAPVPVNLTIGPGEHQVVLRLAATVEFGGAVSFPSAVKAAGPGGADELSLDMGLGDLDALPGAKPAKGKTPEPALALDMGLDMPALEPVPPPKDAKGKGKTPEPALALDMGLDMPPLEPAPAPKDAKGKGKTPEPALAMDLGLDMPPLEPAPPPKDAKGKGKTPEPALAMDLGLDMPPLEPAPPAKPPALAAATPPATPPGKTPPPAAKPPEKPPAKPPAVAVKPPAKPPAKPPEKPPAVAVAPPKVVEPPRPPEPPKPPPKLGPVEIGPRAGWALARNRLTGQGIYLLEVGYRLEAAGLPKLRLTLTGGYTLLTGAWKGMEAGRGKGWFYQNTDVVPIELGATWDLVSFGGFDRFTLYAGGALGAGWARTTLQRFSLYPKQAGSLVPGVTATAGLRIQVSRSVLTLALRHNESFQSPAGLGTQSQRTLSASSLLGGFAVSF